MLSLPKQGNRTKLGPCAPSAWKRPGGVQKIEKRLLLKCLQRLETQFNILVRVPCCRSIFTAAVINFTMATEMLRQAQHDVLFFRSFALRHFPPIAVPTPTLPAMPPAAPDSAAAPLVPLLTREQVLRALRQIAREGRPPPPCTSWCTGVAATRPAPWPSWPTA